MYEQILPNHDGATLITHADYEEYEGVPQEQTVDSNDGSSTAIAPSESSEVDDDEVASISSPETSENGDSKISQTTRQSL
jgi:hypothetical protein